MTAETPNKTYIDMDVIDEDGATIGSVSDVIYDDESLEPTWIVVNPGVLRAERYVPVEGSYTTDDGSLMVPFAEDRVKSAPKATGDHVVTHDVEENLDDHYGTTSSS